MKKKYILAIVIVLSISLVSLIYIWQNISVENFIIRYSSDFVGIQIIDEQDEVLGIMTELLNGSEVSYDVSSYAHILKFWIENPTETVRINYEVWELPSKLIIQNRNTGRMISIYKINSEYLYRLFELD